MKRTILLGALAGTMLTSAITAGAMGKIPVGYLYTKNPVYSAPKGLLISTLKEAVFVKLNEFKTTWCCVCQSH